MKLPQNQIKVIKTAAEEFATLFSIELLNQFAKLTADVTLFGFGNATVYLDGDVQWTIDAGDWPKKLEHQIREEMDIGIPDECIPDYEKTLKHLKDLRQRIGKGNS